jgi:hypothetical protein
MTTHVQGWTTLAEDPLVLLREYSFGPGTANAMVVRLPNGNLMITSPPTDVPSAELSALNAHGKVVALLEFNGVHHLGLPACRSCFPAAVTYASPRAAARILKKSKDPGKIESIDALQPLLGDKIRVVPVDGDKLGDVLVRVQTEKGTLLYAGDFFANIRVLPKNLLFRLIFKLTDSGPGFKVFRIFFKRFVADRKAARDSLIREVEANPPAMLVPAHGDVVTQSDLAPTIVSMLRAAIS